MTKADVYDFLAEQRLGVVSTTGPEGTAQSAVVGFAVTPELEIVFDTLAQSRKCRNLFVKANCSFAVWSGEVTVQLEGLAENYRAEEEGPWKEIYFGKWPECREHLKWPGIVYFVVSPKWIRYSDYGKNPPEIVEFTCNQ